MQFQEWKHYFQLNQNQFDHIAWHRKAELTSSEKKTIAKSIQQFQKGENSEGKNLYRFARLMKDDSYLESIKLFIKEEQSHAAVLGRFMKQENIPLLKSHWIDTIFRRIRKLATLENSVIILITAEIIAAIYYQALARATNSRTLNLLCQQILRDEENHIAFQSKALGVFYHKRTRFGRLYIRAFHRLLMTATTILVWVHHKNVLTYKFSLRTFAKEVNREYRLSEMMIRGQVLPEINSSQSITQSA